MSTVPTSALATTAPSAFPALAARCPDASFDPTASLGPEFDNDIFAHDESAAITAEFLQGLATLYRNAAGTDPCRWFTDQGLRTAIATDARLREAMDDTIQVKADLLLRLAGESSYDLRIHPPTVPIDVVYDIAAGAKTTDLPSRTASTSAAPERLSLHVDFVYDGHRWLADRVGIISSAFEMDSIPPLPVPLGPRCSAFVRDRPGTAFDEKSGGDQRRWCDADGHGRVIAQPEQLNLFSRYPCDSGHAAILTIGQPLGSRLDRLVRYEYVRDPAGEFLVQGWVTAPYRARATLPADAAYTGWTNGNIEIWESPTDVERAIYIKRGDTIERWPRAAKEWGVIDCN